ncbi:hypothetical protein EON65_25875 [archaeon]|nr:MAG: hypothetical protein EON65_25875 [archaeon]
MSLYLFSVTNEGKIIFTKASKKRKRPISSCPQPVPMPTLTLSQSKSIFISAYETAVNSGQSDKIRKYFMQYCDPNNYTMVFDLSVMTEYRANVYREMKGIETSMAYLDACIQSTPDSILIFWQKEVVRHPDGSKEIRTDCHYIGRRVYSVDILQDEESDIEHSQLQNALSGLMSLAGAGQEVLSSDLMDQGHTSAEESDGESRGGRWVPTDNTKILVVAENAAFKRGRRLAEEFVINQKAIMSWFISPDNFITKMKFVVI